MNGTNLHDPLDHPSTSIDATTSAPVTIQSEANRLTLIKDSITAKLDTYFEVLKTNNVNMFTPLVDPQDFPRSDIDVAGIRTARHQINCLRNDLKAVMDQMKDLLEKGLPRTSTANGTDVVIDQVEEEPVKGVGQAWAKIDAVAPNSPADSAGLKREDQIVSLGDVNSTNHDNFQALATLVGASEGVTLPLVIKRGDVTLHLRLVPKSGWGGRGLLGCHVVPI